MFPNLRDRLNLRKDHPITQLTRDGLDAMTWPMNGEKAFPVFQSPFFYVSDKLAPAYLHDRFTRPIEPPFNNLSKGKIAFITPGVPLIQRFGNGRVKRAILITDIKHDILAPNIVMFPFFSYNEHG